ncbi:MAG: RnfABCDGE type electron transport complex subunit B [Lachnospiraceae bacterium]|jgi:Na+-translocating ferredoxin:NAD+ oxidoreductase RNF subunit RnfB|nr:RnfABCDGE type electron transport complex subunit B [Lachnospiraceae bacterium]MCH4030288.1 RnfABCDGE type electron transport complex subunit B [Lachnospiraceae bacterium]MCH4069500.1 RnfABCDGE type electron transport complex subunit B [Lachnospiraceae bacterium]MCH4107564.1 RnfABCDGE type electron transport complex subunit B [Lachnospiraceae bacterium]MCI1301585.1 RnfABCDGE type electron transport complex subunit B [Lachnospiraceae bacterium]
MSGIIIAAVVVGGTGLALGFFLSIMGKKFEVPVDEKEAKVRELLPGNNCGGCGYAGCDACAKAIAAGQAPVGACPVGGEPVAKQIAQIMGSSAGEMRRMTAWVRCEGDCQKAPAKYKYSGVQDCSVMPFLPDGGPKICTYGCLGFGSCVKACEFDAIHVKDGVAAVDRDKCKACGKCVAACPRHLISMVPYDNRYVVDCASRDKGKDVMGACSVGCIGCRICEKNCPADAVHVTDNLAVIDYDKCKNCGICASKCPRKIITQRF